MVLVVAQSHFAQDVKKLLFAVQNGCAEAWCARKEPQAQRNYFIVDGRSIVCASGCGPRSSHHLKNGCAKSTRVSVLVNRTSCGSGVAVNKRKGIYP